MLSKIDNQVEEFNQLVCQLQQRLNSKNPDWVFAKDLTDAQFVTGINMHRHGTITMSQLSEELKVSLPTLTGIIDRMVKNGYVKRARGKTDRRVVQVNLTKKGVQVIEKVHQIKHARMRSMILALNEKDRNIYLRLMKKVVERLDNIGSKH